MGENALPRVVLDTNVVFEGLTKQGGLCGVIVDAWFHGLIQVCLSDALAYEYVDVLSRKLSPTRLAAVKTTLAVLFDASEIVPIYYRWRPSSPDPGDELVVDCTMNANALLVTSNVRDFRLAQQSLRLQVMTPRAFVAGLLI